MSFAGQTALTAGQSASFTVTSPGATDGALLKKRNAASIRDCGGEDVSPPLAWSQPPAGTQSHAVVMTDPDGGKGLGSVHWVAYGIASSTSALGEGAGMADRGLFVGGTNSRDTLAYAGPCPPIGDQPHHYVFSVYALDLKPGTLPPGLTRDALLQAIRGHVLAEASIVLRYAR
jgi:Raf kinase inhibitor-like YbhB/YbcL family protein